MKGILLAGGAGTRLHPLTMCTSKHLLPIYDKPMVYYPLSVLMLANIRDILLITTPEHLRAYQTLLGSGERFGLKLSYTTQTHPTGLSDALVLGRDFIDNSSVCLILGDNLFWGQGFSGQLQQAVQRIENQGGATLFACRVKDPRRFGVVEFGPHQEVLQLLEKPQNPPSDFAVTGLYFYDQQAVTLAQSIQPSARGEKEITALNQLYLAQQQLHIERLGRGFAWMDMGTPESLFEASQFVESIQQRRGYHVACLEEIALLKQWIQPESLQKQIHTYAGTAYGAYLNSLLQDFSHPLSKPEASPDGSPDA